MNTHDDNTPEANDRESRLTAYALDELDGSERAEVEREMAADPQARQTVEELKQLAPAVRAARAAPVEPPLVAIRQAVVARLDELAAADAPVSARQPAERAWRRRLTWLTGGVALGIAGCVTGYAVIDYASRHNGVDLTAGMFFGRQVGGVKVGKDGVVVRNDLEGATSESYEKLPAPYYMSDDVQYLPQVRAKPRPQKSNDLNGSPTPTVANDVDAAEIRVELSEFGDRTAAKNNHLARQIGTFPGSGIEGRAAVTREEFVLRQRELAKEQAGRQAFSTTPGALTSASVIPSGLGEGQGFGGKPEKERLGFDEQYEAPPENAFLPVDKATALSTFSIDVDTASYANVRRFLSQGRLPPPAAVRIEEMLNYFRYSYPQPQGNDPFSVNMELADCPWQPGHQLLRIGLKGREVQNKERKAGNLVFLVDVSGSMEPENKLPLLKQALKLLAAELTENDRVTIVTYAGEAGLKLDATNGSRQIEIRDAIDSLHSGGSTHGSAGIELAYQKATQTFIKGGTNRVILATDGDLNVGITSDEALVELIKTKAASGVFLTVLGVGDGNLKDARMEKLADNGNGVYAYLDSLREARKVLVEQLAGSLETIAKDVKLQVEFNPAEVAAYRLVGYENRVLAERDFHDDKKDAGEIGAGHTVTALYELVPAKALPKDGETKTAGGTPLKYQKSPEPKPVPEALTPAAGTGEVLTLKLRFKQPDAETSVLREYPLKSEGGRFNRASGDFQFAAAVASFGMLLRGSPHRGDATFSGIEEIAAGAAGPDAGGYRAEFLDLVRKAKGLK